MKNLSYKLMVNLKIYTNLNLTVQTVPSLHPHLPKYSKPTNNPLTQLLFHS